MLSSGKTFAISLSLLGALCGALPGPTFAQPPVPPKAAEEPSLLAPAAAVVSKSPLSIDDIDLDDPDASSALVPASDSRCRARLPNGGIPGVFPQASEALGGRCAAIAFAAKAYEPVLAAHRSLWCEDPGGSKLAAGDLARQALAAPPKAGFPPDFELAALGLSKSDQARLPEPLRHDAREREICSRWDDSGPSLSPSLSVFAVGVATISGKRCPAALMEVRVVSGRHAPAKAHFLAGIAECEGSYALPSSPFALSFLSPATSESLSRKLLSSANWRGPSPRFSAAP